MKYLILKHTLLLGLFIFLSACQKKSEDIKLSDLKTSCDYIDALDLVLEEMIQHNGAKPIKELSDEEITVLRNLKKKFREIEKAATKKYTSAEIKECNQFAILEEKLDRFRTTSDVFKFGFK